MPRPKMPKVNARRPEPNPINLNRAELIALDDKVCCQCQNTTFIEGIRLKVLPVTHLGNNTGQTQHIPTKVLLCAVCQKELEL